MNEADPRSTSETTTDPVRPDKARVRASQANLVPLSRGLHAVGTFTSKSLVAAVVTAAVLIFLVLLGVGALPSEWQGGFWTISAAVTVVMVFVIQHTQSRQQLVTQLKLDELIHSSPHADDRVVKLEAAADEELAVVEVEHLRHHRAMRSEEEEADAGWPRASRAHSSEPRRVEGVRGTP